MTKKQNYSLTRMYDPGLALCTGSTLGLIIFGGALILSSFGIMFYQNARDCEREKRHPQNTVAQYAPGTSRSNLEIQALYNPAIHPDRLIERSGR